MQNRLSKYHIVILCLLTLVIFISGCKKDDTTDTEIPRNYFEGIADDGSFETTESFTIKDDQDVFYIIANATNNGLVVAAFQGTEAMHYPSVDDNSLQPIADLLTGLVGEDFDAIFEALEEINTDSATFIQNGGSFLLLVDETGGSYSYRGGITVTELDESINRVYGFMDIELTNALNDSKFFTGDFQDLLYLDCDNFPCL